MQFDAAGTIAGPRGGPIRVQGHSDQRTKEWFLTLNGQSPALEYWSRYFAKPSTEFRVLAAGGDHRQSGFPRAIIGDCRRERLCAGRYVGSQGAFKSPLQCVHRQCCRHEQRADTELLHALAPVPLVVYQRDDDLGRSSERS